MSPLTPPRRPAPLRRRSLLAAGALTPPVLLGLAACGADDGGGEAPDLLAEVPREKPGAPQDAGPAVVPFTARILGAIDRGEVNAVCSPLSVQVALTMIGMGASGDTRAQMEEVLGAPMEDLAASANTLSQVLATVGDEQREADEEDGPEPSRASLVNATWLQEGLSVEDSFLEDLSAWFGSGVFEADFRETGPREKARERINDWVADSTADLIEELVPEGALGAATRLVLVNALHLKAAWPSPLTTSGGRFTTSAGEEVGAEMLSGDAKGWYENELCRATALPTAGGELALALIQPVEDVASVLEAWSSSATDSGTGLGALLSGLEESVPARLTLPRFDIDGEASLTGTLQELGMVDAFSGDADFSGVTSEADLAITDVLHKAVITVDEEGMEAAAATAVMVGETAAPAEPKELVLESPFLYVAYERSTLAPLVTGWIGDPTQTR